MALRRWARSGAWRRERNATTASDTSSACARASLRCCRRGHGTPYRAQTSRSSRGGKRDKGRASCASDVRRAVCEGRWEPAPRAADRQGSEAAIPAGGKPAVGEAAPPCDRGLPCGASRSAVSSSRTTGAAAAATAAQPPWPPTACPLAAVCSGPAELGMRAPATQPCPPGDAPIVAPVPAAPCSHAGRSQPFTPIAVLARHASALAAQPSQSVLAPAGNSPPNGSSQISTPNPSPPPPAPPAASGATLPNGSRPGASFAKLSVWPAERDCPAQVTTARSSAMSASAVGSASNRTHSPASPSVAAQSTAPRGGRERIKRASCASCCPSPGCCCTARATDSRRARPRSASRRWQGADDAASCRSRGCQVLSLRGSQVAMSPVGSLPAPG
eukprot:scaffold8679_cov121-Isochrysis_galbana.AAC.6